MGKKGDVALEKLKFSALEMNVVDKSKLRADLNEQIYSGVGMFPGNQFRTFCFKSSDGKSVFSQM